jgi:high-affinity nickel permease
MSLVVAGLHAFDADHIAAIDSTTRKLLAEGRREGWNTHLSAPSEPS